MSQLQSSPVGFRFINSAHPRDATTASSLSRIRSHAARDIRARRRISRQAASALPLDTEATSLACHLERPLNALIDQAGQTSKLDLAEKPPECIGSGDYLPVHRPLSDPLRLPWLSYRDPLLTPARLLSAAETSLLDHCKLTLSNALLLLARELPNSCITKILIMSFWPAMEVALSQVAWEVDTGLIISLGPDSRTSR
jgi:hypothetical protein